MFTGSILLQGAPGGSAGVPAVPASLAGGNFMKREADAHKMDFPEKGQCTEYDTVGPPWPLAEDGGCPSKMIVPYTIDGHPNAGGVKVYPRPDQAELSHNNQFDVTQSVFKYYDYQADEQQEEAEAELTKAVDAATPNPPPGQVNKDEEATQVGLTA